MMILKGSAYVLLDYLSKNAPTVTTLEDLSDQIGYCDKTIRAAMKTLKQYGLVKAVSTNGRGPSHYEVLPVTIDWCKYDRHVGYVEYVYPASRWEIVDAISKTYTEPDQAAQDAARKKGATVLAYGGDGTWFAIRPKGDK